MASTCLSTRVVRACRLLGGTKLVPHTSSTPHTAHVHYRERAQMPEEATTNTNAGGVPAGSQWCPWSRRERTVSFEKKPVPQGLVLHTHPTMGSPDTVESILARSPIRDPDWAARVGAAGPSTQSRQYREDASQAREPREAQGSGPAIDRVDYVWGPTSALPPSRPTFPHHRPSPPRRPLSSAPRHPGRPARRDTNLRGPRLFLIT